MIILSVEIKIFLIGEICNEIRITAGFANTSNCSAEPLRTKNSVIAGPDQRSACSISSSLSGQKLQNTVPSIMHTRRLEKPNVNGPTGIFSWLTATVMMTLPTISAFRFRWE